MKEHVIILMDISYSMQRRAQSMIDGLNKFVESLKARPDHEDILFTVMLFSDWRTYLCRGVPVDNVSLFTLRNFPNFGMTHLYDAIGDLVQDWIQEKRARHHLFIVTDGEDNGSKTVSKEQASQACDMVIRKHGWTITHCDVDVSKLDSASVNKVVYDIDDLENILSSLSI